MNRVWIDRGVTTGAVIMAISVLLVVAARYYPFIADDALISFRYAERLSNGQGLTWTDGERVEGYSNLLWTLIMAVGALFGADLIPFSRVVGVGAFAGLFALLIGTAGRWGSRAPGLLAALLIAGSGVAGVWSIGGLEQPLLALLLGWTLLRLGRLLEAEEIGFGAAGRASVPLALLCLTRPEGPLFAGVAAALLFALQGWRAAARYIVWPAAVTVGHYLGRFAYYGEWFPNTAYIKVAFSTGRLTQGLRYLSEGSDGLSPVLMLAGFGLVAAAAGHRRRLALAALTMVMAWAAYLVFVGGDIFPGYRHFIPILVPAGVLVLVGMDWLYQRCPGAWPMRAVAVSWVIAAGGLQLKLQHDHPEYKRAIYERWEWDGQVVGNLFGAGFRQEQPLLAVTAAGCIPYFSKLPALDLLGLNDWHIARTHPKRPGALAHDHGDGEYALDRKPDIILMNVEGGRLMFVSGREMQTDERFRRFYRPAVFEGYDPYTVRTAPFVRRDGRVGIKRQGAAVTYPAYLLENGAVGVLGPDDRMVARLPAGQTLTSESIRLPEGTWQLRTMPPVPDLKARIDHECGAAVSTAAGSSRLILASPCDVRGILETPSREILLQALRFEKVARSDAVDGVAGGPGGLQKVRELGTFDRATGWQCAAGDCSRWITTSPAPGQARISGHSGGFVNTFDPVTGDAAKGMLESPVFAIPDNGVISFRMGGGKGKVGLRLMIDGRVALAWHNRDNSERLTPVRTDLSLFAGRSARLVVFDDSDAAWGHVLVDDIVLFKRR